MGSATIYVPEQAHEGADTVPAGNLPPDPRLQLVERIAASEPFQKSSRLPRLLLYLANNSINGDRHKLTEQAIGQAIFSKGQHYNPAEDSSVRVYVRQLRLKLHEYYGSSGAGEDLIVSVPKGGYTLEFSPTSTPEAVPAATSTAVVNQDRSESRGRVTTWFLCLSIALSALTLFFGFGWYRATSARASQVPWPLAAVFQKGATTTLVTADAGTALRMLGNQEVSLDSYIDHGYLQSILPKHMSQNESIVLHYFDSSRVTSEADAKAAAVIGSLAGPFFGNLTIRSARDVNANDLEHGNFIFVGSKTSNPWVALLDSRMNFQMVEDGPHGLRYILNRNPRAGEKKIYQIESMGTLATGDDYAIIALLPAKTGGGTVLLLEGVRMEGTEAAVALLRNEAGRTKLQDELVSLNHGRTPRYFEVLLHAQSVAGATISVDVVAARASQ